MNKHKVSSVCSLSHRLGRSEGGLFNNLVFINRRKSNKRNKKREDDVECLGFFEILFPKKKRLTCNLISQFQDCEYFNIFKFRRRSFYEKRKSQDLHF